MKREGEKGNIKKKNKNQMMGDRRMSRRWQIQNKQAMKCGISFETPATGCWENFCSLHRFFTVTVTSICCTCSA